MADQTAPGTLARGMKRRHNDNHLNIPEDAKRLRPEGIKNTDSGRYEGPEPIHNLQAGSSLHTHEDFSPLSHEPAGVKYLVVHQVICNRHAEHTTTYYKECPRLFAGDTRATALHGQHRINYDVFSEEFTEENPTIGFVVMKSYNCGDYHANQLSRNHFQPVSLPDTAAKALAQFKAHLSYLEEEGPQAEIMTEKLYIIGHELRLAMKAFGARYPKHFLDMGEVPEALDAPYLTVYHARPFLPDILRLTEELSDEQRAHASCMFSYIQTSHAVEYQEADDYFARGIVTRQHFAKLFSPDDILVQATKYGPEAYAVSETSTIKDGNVELTCWNWHFDGTFFKKNGMWTVTCPSVEHEVPIASLALYPLRVDTTGLKKRLYDRGLKFWSCRKQRLVECDTLATNHEFRAVSDNCIFHLDSAKIIVRRVNGSWWISIPTSKCIQMQSASMRAIGMVSKTRE
jgi:hypothetical protein